MKQKPSSAVSHGGSGACGRGPLESEQSALTNATAHSALRRASHWLGCGACAAVMACGAGPAGSSDASESAPSGGQHPDPDFSREKVLENLGERVFDHYIEFAASTEALVDLTEAYAQSLDSADQLAAKEGWREAIATWQRAELFRFGPAGEAGIAIGGAGLADEIYSWMVSTNSCRVDQETVEGTFENLQAMGEEPINVRGLDALEYLLFTESLDNTCEAILTLNSEGTWEALRDEIAARRAAYSHALALDLDSHAKSLLEAWDPAAGGFLEQFARAGAAESAYASPQEAFEAVGNALFYLDTQTKDRKLGIPAGILGCEQMTCPDQLESPFARASRSHIANNLAGFELLFFGHLSDEPEAFGLDDQLRDVGADTLADAMGQDIKRASESVRAIENQTLIDALGSNVEAVREIYDRVKAVTDQLKTSFVEELELEISSAGPGDTD